MAVDWDVIVIAALAEVEEEEEEKKTFRASGELARRPRRSPSAIEKRAEPFVDGQSRHASALVAT